MTRRTFLIHLEVHGDFAASRRSAERNVEHRLDVLASLRSRGTTATARATSEYRPEKIAEPAEAAWIGERFRRACAALGTYVAEEQGRLVVTWPRSGA